MSELKHAPAEQHGDDPSGAPESGQPEGGRDEPMDALAEEQDATTPRTPRGENL